MMIIRTAIRAPLMLVFSFVMAFVMGGRMAWIFLVTLPLLSIGLALVISRTIPLFRKVFRKYDKLNESIQENIKAMRVVKSFVREDYEQRKFNAAAEDVCRDFTRAERILAFNGPMMQFCIYATMVFVLSFGSYTIITSRGLDLDVGQFSSLLTYNFMMLNSLMMLSMIFVMIVHLYGVLQAHCGGPHRGEHPARSRQSGAGGGGRVHRLRQCKLQIQRQRRADGTFQH